MYGQSVFTNESIEGSYPEYALDGVRVVRASRTPCIVCGHTTGDCTGGTMVKPRHILGESMFEGKHSLGNDFLLTEDLHDTVNITPRTTTKVLVGRAGTYISREKALEFGLVEP